MVRRSGSRAARARPLTRDTGAMRPIVPPNGLNGTPFLAEWTAKFPRLAWEDAGMAWKRAGRRLPQLFIGLTIYGLSGALMVRARLGLDPWDVLHQGIARHTGLAIGTVVILVGAVVLLG